MSERVVVKAPASSANLGPGFDCLAAALDLWLTVEVERTGEFAVETELDIPKDRSNLLVSAFERITPADQYTFKITSEIPLSGGLGSSAAAIVAGLKAASTVSGGPESDSDLLQLAAELEGHPDNAAAAIYGGFVACDQEDKLPVQLNAPAGLSAVVVIPSESVRTADARMALPALVTLEDAVFNSANSARLVLGIERCDLQLIASSLGDRLHQSQRAMLFPRSYDLLKRAEQFGALGATISGAGPSVMFWVESNQSERVKESLAAETSDWAAVIDCHFTDHGVA